jgi:nucleotide-binding universal stress UspA family protein
MRVVLVPVAGRPECAQALTTAFELAGRLQADVIGCHIRPHRYSRVRLPDMLTDSAGWDVAMKGRNPDQMSRAARKMFAGLAGRFDVSAGSRPRSDGAPVAIWQERVGSPQKVMPIIGPVSDLIVVSRPATHNSRVATIFMMEALLHSSRPVLILPQKAVTGLGSRVAVAWNQSPEAAKAVAMSMPVLQNADEVTVISAGVETSAGPKASHLVRYLKHQGISARTIKTRDRHVEKELIGAYRDCGANLMVMGAYSRHRLTQLIFGGLTRHMLHTATIPVLMYHG